MALTYDDLWNKAKIFIERAIAQRNNGAFDEFQLWAAIALEVLGKAALARIHPILIVNPEKFESLLIACGYRTSTDYKTIMATTLFERCRLVVKNFDKIAENFCLQMANLRNADLHSGEVPFEGVALGTWQPKYWQVTKLLLESQGKSLKDYVGDQEAAAAEEIITDASSALEKAVMGRLRKHESAFKKAHPASQRKQVVEHTRITINARLGRDEIACPCPACGCPGILSGEYLEEEERGPAEDEPWIMEVEEFYGAEFFECVVCGLKLDGVDEIDAGGLKTSFSKRDYKEITYEADYGND